jgi:hypothetical protein
MMHGMPSYFDDVLNYQDSIKRTRIGLKDETEMVACVARFTS